jgi:multimeric flavodoxin WrbA
MSSGGDRRVVVINGGPRKKWNTARLLEKAAEGARSAGAQAELVHLFDLTFKGCVSCFACKLADGSGAGRCAQRDSLSPVLESLEGAQAVILGSPIYLSDVTGAARSFLERWIFINLAYDADRPAVLEKAPAVGMIYTMNVPEPVLETPIYSSLLLSHRHFLERIGAPAVEQLASCDTLQFDDYSRYHAPLFDEASKRKGREERFPLELEKAFQMGARLASI